LAIWNESSEFVWMKKKVGAVVVKRFVGRSDTPVMAAMV